MSRRWLNLTWKPVRPFANLRLAAMLVGCISVASALAEGQDRAPPVDYDREIRPILSDKCFHCHGPDGETREAELRLDTREGLVEHVVVPGKPDESELVVRVTSEDPEMRMPPPDSKLSVSAEQQELLRRWIAEGATVTEHWAFQELPASVPVPAVKNESWPREPLDRFVLARLETEKLQPAAEAEPLRLLRRVTLDLTGLPPTADECRDFEKAVGTDGVNAALSRAVERLVASPAYGEQMAVAWLDAARYADSYGYQSDHLNTQWPYRDWVVRAFNENLPYDQFVTWQLAGDLLENPTRDQVLATAFNRLHRLTNEGGSIPEEWLVENAADRVHTFGTAVLGLTFECARCHDHKYDPITTRDYYSLMAFFNSIPENGLYDNPVKVPAPSLMLPTEEQERQLAAAREKVVAAESALSKAIEEGQDRFASWVAKPQVATVSPPRSGEGPGEGRSGATTIADLIAYFTFDGPLGKLVNEAPGGSGEGSAGGLTSVPGIRGQAVRFDGDRGAAFPGLFQVDRWDNFTLDFWLRDVARNASPVVVLQRTFGTDTGYNGFDVMIAGGVLEVRLYRVWPGNGIGVRSLRPIARDEWQHVAITYDGSSKAGGLQLYLNGEPLETGVLRDEIYKSAAPATFGAGQFTLGERFRDRGFKDGEIDELRIYSRPLAPIEVRNLHDGKSLAAAIADAQGHREELASVYFSAIDAEARERLQQLTAARREFVTVEDGLQEIPVMKELPSPRATHVLARGAYDAPKTDENRVERDTPKGVAIPFPADAPRNRLGLSRWATQSNHPLTARVFVNRLWANFFGRPLVATPENFGRQGAVPTNRELLDWLARDFVDHGWDVKRLCCAIALSATYRQDSRCSAELRERDPENLLLARGPSRRLSAEQIRDLALSASGLMDSRPGGPPVSPYQPGGDLWRETNTMSPAYQQSVGRDLYRRSLYSVWKRTAPLPNMLAFDATTREVCTVYRGRTNTPLQALVLLNDVQFVEAARTLAVAVLLAHPKLEDQIAEAFVRLTARKPDATELQHLVDLCAEQRALFADNEQAAEPYLQLGESKVEGGVAPAELAALTVVCQAILNLDATIYER